MKARIAAMDYALPRTLLTNEALTHDHPDWKIDKMSKTTGIRTRRVATEDEYTSGLAVSAAGKLFARHDIDPTDIDYLILCTQSPDYFLPTTACIVHAEIGMRLDAGAVDVTLGCSGFIYALGLAKGLIESGQVRNVLVITAESFSKFVNPNDKATRPIFGDAATATLVLSDPNHDGLTGIVLGTDGRGGPGLVVPNGGLRDAEEFSPNSSVEARGLQSNGYDMYMDGLEIFNFTIRVVPGCVDEVLRKAALTMSDVDLFVFHQANGYLIEHLRKKLEIPTEKFVVSMEDYGNTGSSTIPIALTDAVAAGRVHKGDKIMLVGFGVGLSWGGVLVTW